VADTCECGNEPSGSIKCGEFLSTCFRITSAKCRMNTAVSPDDGHIVARNMQRLINILRINILRTNYAPSRHYL
jgi:hypothetical protein